MFDVIIPTKNSGKTLHECLVGLQDSDVPIKRIIVIDKFSTDATVEIAKSFGCIVISSSANCAKAQIMGAQIAEGEYFMIVDSDIVINPKFYSVLSKHYKQNFISKGIYVNQLPKIYHKIIEKDIDFFRRGPCGFEAIIAHRETFLKISPLWKGMDAGTDTHTFRYCDINDIPCYQDINLRSKHLVTSLRRIWRNTIWFGRSARKSPVIYGEDNLPLTFASKGYNNPFRLLIKYRCIILFFHQIVCTICWVWGWLTG